MRRLLVTTSLAVSLLAVPLLAVPAAAGTSSLTFSPRVVTFGHVPAGTAAHKAVTLTNKGSDPLTVNGYEVFSEGPSFSGNFTLDPGSCTLSTTLAPGEACTFTILTSPMAAGPLHGQFCYTMIGATGASDRACGRLVGAAS